MIIINLKGGLGNQMFEYACGRALSLRQHDPKLKIDIEGLEQANGINNIYRPYSLSNFNIKAEIANKKEIKESKNPYGLISKFWRLFRKKILRQNYVAFVPKITTLHANNIYLDGYFQTEKYFKDFKKEIREDFTPKVISTTASDWTQKIKNGGNTISVHVRRGDYVGHKILGEICTIEYYQKAIEEISKLTEDPHFFIFSDDTMWVKENINLPNKIDYVSSPNLKDYEELVLMSICHHNIIANSSFSWWSAWLNLNPNKIVIAPAKWAHGKFNKKKLSNIAPQTWIRI